MQKCRLFFHRNSDALRVSPGISDPKHARAKTLQKVASTFLDGFVTASELECPIIEREIQTLPEADRGVCYEGAAAGKTVRDLTIQSDLNEASALLHSAESYSFLMYLGIGEAMAQLKLPPVLCNSVANERWSGQILEGYGFFDGYFNWYDALVHQKYPDGLEPGLRAAYDQGIGRAIYFVTNCNPQKIKDQISCFAPNRRAEIWSGAGIPTAYVGGLTEYELKKFLDYAGEYRAELVQGVLLGASARVKQNKIPDHTEMACNVICAERTINAVNYSEKLSQLLIQREQFSMFEWQKLVRQELRLDGC